MRAFSQHAIRVDGAIACCHILFMEKALRDMVKLSSGLMCALSLSACVALGADTIRRPALPSPINRCMNLSDGLEAAYEGEWNYTVRLADIDMLAEAGFDTIRVPIRWSGHAGRSKPYTLEPVFLARVDKIINYALSKDLNVIINVHHYAELSSDPVRHGPRLQGIWKQLATHYKDYPDKLIFEVVNEPHDAMSMQRVDALNASIVRHIRKSQPQRWIILATGDWGSLNGLLSSSPPPGLRNILSWHYYEPFAFTHKQTWDGKAPPPPSRLWGSEDELARAKADFQKAAAFRDRMGHPLLLGEFGVFRDVPVAERAKWVRTVREEAEKNQFGWCHWGFSSNFRAYDADKEAWIEPIRAALLDD